MTLYSNRGSQPSPDAERNQKNSLPELTVTVSPALYDKSPRQSAEYFLKLGNQHYNSFLSRSKKHDLDIAINCYRRALETNPDLSEAYIKLASALYAKGELPLPVAMDYCKKALEMNPANTEAHVLLGYFYRLSGDLDKAVAEFRKAIKKNPLGAAKPRMGIGRICIQKATENTTIPAVQRLGLTLSGLHQFTLGLLLIPFDNASLEMLHAAFVADARIYSVLNIGRMLKAMGMISLAIRLYEWAGKKMPTEPIFFHLLGDLYNKLRNDDAAIYYYSRAQELDGDNLLIHKKLSRCYSRCNDPQRAVESLQRVVEVDSDDFDSLYMLAQLYTEQHDFMRALYHFKDLVRRRPESPYIHSNMAYILFKLEDYDGAIKHYQLAVNYGEDNVWTSTVAQTLGTIYYQIKQDLSAASAMFQLANQLDPANQDVLTMLADIYSEQGNLEAAVTVYKTLLLNDPDNPECLTYLGYLLWQLDRNDEAVRIYQRAIANDPGNAIAYNNLGVIFLDERDNPAEAIDMFQHALEVKPDYTLACFNVGRTYERMGRTTEAAKIFSDALALNAANPELTDDEILERLDSLFQV
jgi:tetratricopeptide (TPR) repeat protein